MVFHCQILKLITLALLLICADDAWAERKALVIGNAAYAEKRLPNPGHDAEDMKARLEALGFAVDLLEDADKRAMLEALNRFSQKLQANDDALFFYAGHGAQSNGHNYLIPLHAKIVEDADLEYEALDLGQILGKLEHAKNGFKLAILDACRNNPYTRSFRDGSRGLARIDAPSGTLIWYAAEPGKVAEDGKGRNGTFTQHLLQVINQPGLDADAVFKNTAREVYQATEGRQFPYPEGVSLVDFKFAEGATTASKPAEPTPAAVELSFWDSMKNSENPKDFDEYLKQYPQGRFVGLAHNRAERLNVAKTQAGQLDRLIPEATESKPLHQISGAWEGKACQNSGGCWTISIVVPQFLAPYGLQAKIQYPSLECKGSLDFINADNNTFVFKEKIIDGTECVNNGLVYLTQKSNNELSYVWAFPNGKKEAKTELTRVKQ